MRLLVITQKVDRADPALGFFLEWLRRLSARTERLIVICLEQGEFELPNNVTVLSLGKEKMLRLPKLLRRLVYYFRFRRLIRQYQNDYDGVFVHMNPEYVVLGGWWWRKHQKKILLWYVHKSVNWWLKQAEKRADKIFTASPESFRLPSAKVEVVGHGIPVELFAAGPEEIADPHELWLLAVGRISAVKNYEIIFQALIQLQQVPDFPHLRFTIVGSPITAADKHYQKYLEEMTNNFELRMSEGAADEFSRRAAPRAPRVSAATERPSRGRAVGFRSERKDYLEMPSIYHRYHLLIHPSRTGSADKVVLEALAAGRYVITSSPAYADAERAGVVWTFPAGDAAALAQTIEKMWQNGILKPEKLPNQAAIGFVRAHHNLDTVIGKIIDYFEE